MESFLYLALLLSVSLVSATENRMCAEVCWTYHIGDPNCESSCLNHPSYSPQSATVAEQCIANCLVENSGGADLVAFAECRTKCLHQYFGEFLRTYSPKSKRSALFRMPGFYSPTVVCEDPEEYDRVYRQCFQDFWEKSPMHPQSSFINRTERGRGCSVRIVYRSALHSKRDATPPFPIPLESIYDDDHPISSLGSSEMEEHICRALCLGEGEEECLPNCLLFLDSRTGEFHLVIKCAVLCLRGDALVGGANLSFLVCVRGCLMEITAGLLPLRGSSEISSGLTPELPGAVSPPSNETNSARALAQYAMNQPSSADSTYNFCRYRTWTPAIILGVYLGSF
ncbi:unnamed protein product [Tuber aestivum]|uniref:Extracellular membrane protein CFEM domain-containing protein n=1 Tax=Tuber aestivum TaxID=59557 RepID=A0A292PVI9_9PEZI|nr:unnamed protein product [Tuber aestivum]